MSTAHFSLRNLVHSVLTDTDLADPDEIATEALARIDPDDIPAALGETLRGYVRLVMGTDRNAGPGAAQVANKSAKIAAVQDGLTRQLHCRMHTGDGWKLLAHCTYEDLMFAAAERHDLAKSNAAKAQQFEQWAALVDQYSVATFGELPPDVQMQAFGGQA